MIALNKIVTTHNCLFVLNYNVTSVRNDYLSNNVYPVNITVDSKKCDHSNKGKLL